MKLNILADEFVPSMEEYPILLTRQLEEQHAFDALEQRWIEMNIEMFEDSQQDLDTLLGPDVL